MKKATALYKVNPHQFDILTTVIQRLLHLVDVLIQRIIKQYWTAKGKAEKANGLPFMAIILDPLVHVLSYLDPNVQKLDMILQIDITYCIVLIRKVLERVKMYG